MHANAAGHGFALFKNVLLVILSSFVFANITDHFHRCDPSLDAGFALLVAAGCWSVVNVMG